MELRVNKDLASNQVKQYGIVKWITFIVTAITVLVALISNSETTLNVCLGFNMIAVAILLIEQYKLKQYSDMLNSLSFVAISVFLVVTVWLFM